MGTTAPLEGGGADGDIEFGAVRETELLADGELDAELAEALVVGPASGRV
jgi:hypothetical protein